MKNVLLTGAAGFIGSSLLEHLLQQQYTVTGVDNFDRFYSIDVKKKNLEAALAHPGFHFIESDICDPRLYEQLAGKQFDMVIHLAAKAGVRPSMIDPNGYNMANVMGTSYLLEFARNNNITRFIFASSSSVYGVNKNLPWSVDDKSLLPISVYASTKLAGEQLCALYHRYFGLKVIALRFFTVFGPRQRPDLAIHKFVKAIDEGGTIPLFGNGQTFRDYTFIDDIVSGIMGAVRYENDEFQIFNLGNTHTVSLTELLSTIEDVMGKKANVTYLPEQMGDVPYTWSNIEKSQELLGYNPQTNIREGISRFVNWYNSVK
jgi:UDP-glucuronate 4-epimerase